MPPKLKTILIWGIAIFVIYAVIVNPERAATVVQAVWGLGSGAVTGLGRFITGLAA